MDEVFRAIDDPSRRLLLDRLFDEDGQTLTELCTLLPDMTRFGVMSHLRVLEDAGLITTRKVGRKKHHYLNPVPIRLIHDRWISKYAAPIVGAVADMKARLEGGTMSKPDHVYRVYIAAPVQKVWDAITDGDMTQQYFYGTRVESTWEPGSPMVYKFPDGSLASEGKVIACDPPHRVEFTFTALWDPDLKSEGPVREVWMVEEKDGASLLTIEMYDAPEGSKSYDDFVNGFPFIVSGLKTLLETGKPMAAA